MNCVDIISFLRDYYGIISPSLNFKKIKHGDLEELFPFISRCHTKDINMEDLAKGNIIGVYDNSNVIVYYYNPHLCDVINIDDDVDISLDEEKKIDYDLSKLSKDELLKIRSKLRKIGKKEEASKVTKQIRIIKEEEPKDYYKKKEKLLIKESYYDKY